MIVSETETIVADYMGTDVDTSEYSLIGQIIRVFAYREYRLWETLEDVFYSGYLESASGENLDRLLLLLGMVRKSAAKATGTITVTGASGTVIPAGSIVQDSTGALRFVTDETISIGLVPTKVPVTAREYGSTYNLAIGKITTFVPAISGVTYLTNTAEISGGQDVETDEEFRTRSKSAAKGTGKGTLSSIKNALESYSGVEYADVVENTSTNALAIMVAGSASDDEVNAVILDTKPAGIAYSLQRFTDENIKVYGAITPTTMALNGKTLINTAIATISDYISTIPRGGNCEWWEVYRRLLKNVDNTYDVSNLEIISTARALSTVSPRNPLIQSGDLFAIQTGKKFTPTLVNFWIAGRENPLTVNYLVSKVADFADTDVNAAVTAVISGYIKNLTMGIDPSWDDLRIAIKGATVSGTTCISDVLYLKVSGALQEGCTPGSTLTIEETYRATQGTISGNISLPTPITGTIWIERNSTGVTSEITPVVDTIIKNKIWSKGVGGSILPADCQAITQAILAKSGLGVQSIVKMVFSDGTNTVTSTGGSITIDSSHTPIMETNANTIIVGTVMTPVVTAVIERDAGASISTIQTSVTSKINTALAAAGLGTAIEWNNIRNAILTEELTNSVCELSILVNSSTLLSTTDASLSTSETTFVVPGVHTINVVDIVTTTITCTLVRSDAQYTSDAVTADARTRILNYIAGKNKIGVDNDLSWVQVRDALLYNNNLVTSVSSLSIQAKAATANADGNTIVIADTDYLKSGSITVTVS